VVTGGAQGDNGKAGDQEAGKWGQEDTVFVPIAVSVFCISGESLAIR
jgi:hypothetical protein